jgi:hypothetical protein
MNRAIAFAEINFNQDWNLSPAGTDSNLRYWAHVHFENDPQWGKDLWTLFVELDAPPIKGQKLYRAKIYFVAPNAPDHLLRPERKFKLCVGETYKAKGVIKSIVNE